MEFNSFNNVDRALCKEHLCKVSTNSDKQFQQIGLGEEVV